MSSSATNRVRLTAPHHVARPTAGVPADAVHDCSLSVQALRSGRVVVVPTNRAASLMSTPSIDKGVREARKAL